jgi:hypothetical protein
MDKVLLERALAQVEGHIQRGELHVTRQREIVADKKRLGADHRLSATLLETFEMLLVEHKGHRTNLLRALNAV